MEFSPLEQHMIAKLSSDDIKNIKMTKIVMIGITCIIMTIALSIAAYDITDRIETGHAVVSTRTEQTVNYPDKDKITDVGVYTDSGSLGGTIYESKPIILPNNKNKNSSGEMSYFMPLTGYPDQKIGLCYDIRK